MLTMLLFFFVLFCPTTTVKLAKIFNLLKKSKTVSRHFGTRKISQLYQSSPPLKKKKKKKRPVFLLISMAGCLSFAMQNDNGQFDTRSMFYTESGKFWGGGCLRTGFVTSQIACKPILVQYSTYTSV